MADILDTETLSKVSSLEVLDPSGTKVPFGSLFEKTKAVVVFIRHFHCGSCQEYTRELAKVSVESLKAAGTRIVIIGCGQPVVIQAYKEETGFEGEIYADPSLTLFQALNFNASMTRTPAGEEKRSYIKDGLVSIVLKSLWRGPLRHPTHTLKAGPPSQLGGDFVLGPGNICTFGSRMKHTEDHVEVADLMRAAGVAHP